MDDKLKKLEILLSMFDARDTMWSKHNRQIATIIQPTVLEALVSLFDVGTDNIEWVDLQIMDTVMLIVCNVVYDPATTLSQFLNRIDSVKRPDTPIQVQRFLRIGIPLAIVFSTKEEIIKFLLTIPVETTDFADEEAHDIFDPDLMENESNNVPITKRSEALGFDTADLSEEQIKKLMLYNRVAETTKQ